jgi:ketosteroid isomerase-like protein
MPDHELVNIIASADAAINAEDFDALMTFYAEDATLVIEPGRWVTGQTALREAFVAIAKHFTHTLRVSQEQMLVIEGAGTALVLAKTRLRGTRKNGEPYNVLRARHMCSGRNRVVPGDALSTIRTVRSCCQLRPKHIVQ